MENESGGRGVAASVDAGGPSPARVEKLAYRTPGTVSVAAQPVPAAIDWRSDERKEVFSVATAPPLAEAKSALVLDLEERLRHAEVTAAATIERLRREGREAVEQARREADQKAQEALDRMARQIGAALESFRVEREEYFARVEREVVELALAIAGRILHREALLDPLLLAGAVRVALGQLGETSGVRLRCPAGDVEHWRDWVAGLAPAPEIVGDRSLAAGECALEATVGNVDLGVRAQLVEIERGFFDLLEQRPGNRGLGTRDIGTRD